MLVEWNSGKHEATVIIALKINRSRNVSESIDEDGYIQMQFINLKSLLCFSMSVHKRGVEFKEWVLVESVVVSLDSTNTFAKEDRKDIEEGLSLEEPLLYGDGCYSLHNDALSGFRLCHCGWGLNGVVWT
ncbi:hypothetical protein Tco_0563988 [Tanacetum coccineum]